MRRRAELNPASEDTDLSRLLAAEAEFERLLANARTEAARILAEATKQAAEGEGGLEGALLAEAAALKARLDGERANHVAELEAVAAADAGRYDRISAERVSTIAGQVLARLVGAA